MVYILQIKLPNKFRNIYWLIELQYHCGKSLSINSHQSSYQVLLHQHLKREKGAPKRTKYWNLVLIYKVPWTLPLVNNTIHKKLIVLQRQRQLTTKKPIQT